MSLEDRIQDFQESDNQLSDHRDDQMLWRDFYDGYQLTPKEKTTLEARKQAPVIYNRIKPKVNFLVGLEQQTRRDPKSFPRTPIHQEDANSVTDSLRYVADNNNFDQTKSEGFENILIEGECGAEVIVDKDSEDFEIEVNLIPWDRQWYDPRSRKKDYSDAGYLGVMIWMDVKDAKRKYGNKEQALSINNTITTSSEAFDDKPTDIWFDAKRNRIRVLQEYFLKDGIWHYCVFTKGGFLVGEKVSPYKNEKNKPECALYYRSGFIDREGRRYGVVKDFIDPQKEINKRRSKGLHLLNVNQVIYEAGAVKDINKSRKELDKPNGVVEILDREARFEVRDGLEQSISHFNMMQEAKSEIDSIGANAAMSGDEERNLSGRALQARQQGGTIEVGPMFDAIKEWELRIYRAAWNRVKQFWTKERWIRVTDDERNLRWVQLNQKITVQQAVQQMQQQGQQIPPEWQAALQENPHAVISEKNKVSELDVDIIIEDSPDTVTIQQEQFADIVELAKSRPDQIPFDMIIELSSLRDKESVLKRMKENAEQNSQIQQIMQKLEVQGKQFENLKTQMEALELKTRAGKNVADSKPDPQIVN